MLYSFVRISFMTVILCILLFPAMAQANLVEGLVGHWKMEEATGVNLVDSSGQGNTGTVVSSPVSTSNCPRGKCLSFNGTNQYVDFGNPAILQLSTLTLAVWFKMTGSTGRYLVGTWCNTLCVPTPNHQTFLSYIDAAGTTSFYLNYSNNDDYNIYALSGGYNDDQWHLYTATFNGASRAVALYMDGVLSTSATTAHGIGATAIDKFIIGAGALGDAAPNYFLGSIDDVRIYNRALTAQEIADLYNKGTVLKAGIYNGMRFN